MSAGFIACPSDTCSMHWVRRGRTLRMEAVGGRHESALYALLSRANLAAGSAAPGSAARVTWFTTCDALFLRQGHIIHWRGLALASGKRVGRRLTDSYR